MIAGEDLDSLAGLHLHGYDLLRKTPRLPGGGRETLAAQRVLVLGLPRDAVFLGAVLRGDSHAAAAVRVGERFPQRILERALSKAQSAPQSADHMRRLAHALHPTGQNDLRFTSWIICAPLIAA